MEKLKVGIFGCGYICKLHLQNILNCQQMEVIALADVNLKAAEKLKHVSGAKYVCSEPDRLIADDSIDAFLIFTPTKSHVNLIEKICEIKKPFFVEKPLGVSYNDCLKIQSLVKKSGVANQVGYWFRYSPLTAAVKRIIKNPYMLLARCIHGSTDDFDYQKKMVERDLIAPNGYLENAGYLFDIALQLISSDPVSIQSMSCTEHLTNTISSNMKFANGALATIVHSDIGPGGFLDKWFFEILGGSMNATIHNWKNLYFTPDSSLDVQDNSYHAGFDKQMQMFAYYVLENTESPLDVWLGSLPTLLMEQSLISASKNETVEIQIPPNINRSDILQRETNG